MELPIRVYENFLTNTEKCLNLLIESAENGGNRDYDVQIEAIRKEHEFLRKQVEKAKKKGLESFDREAFV